jgi:hypothetical protein
VYGCDAICVSSLLLPLLLPPLLTGLYGPPVEFLQRWALRVALDDHCSMRVPPQYDPISPIGTTASPLAAASSCNEAAKCQHAAENWSMGLPCHWSFGLHVQLLLLPTWCRDGGGGRACTRVEVWEGGGGDGDGSKNSLCSLRLSTA